MHTRRVEDCSREVHVDSDVLGKQRVVVPRQSPASLRGRESGRQTLVAVRRDRQVFRPHATRLVGTKLESRSGDEKLDRSSAVTAQLGPKVDVIVTRGPAPTRGAVAMMYSG